MNEDVSAGGDDIKLLWSPNNDEFDFLRILKLLIIL